MDASRLLEIMQMVVGEFEELTIEENLRDVVTSLKSHSEAPGDPSIASIYEENLSRCMKTLQMAPSNGFQPLRKSVLDSLGVGGRTGDGLAREIQTIAESGALAATKHQQLHALLRDVSEKKQALQQAIDSLVALNIEPHGLGKDEWEVGVRLSERLTRGEVQRFNKQMKDWEVFLFRFGNAITGKSPYIRIGGLESGSEWIYLLVKIAGAAWAAKEVAKMAKAWLGVVNGSLDAYKKVQEIIEYHQQGKELEIRQSALKEIAKEQKEREEKEVERVATACVEAHFSGGSDSRPEAMTVTRFMVKFLLKQIEAGTTVETIAGQLEAVPERDGTGEERAQKVEDQLKVSADGWRQIEESAEIKLELPWPESDEVPELTGTADDEEDEVPPSEDTEESVGESGDEADEQSDAGAEERDGG